MTQRTRLLAAAILSASLLSANILSGCAVATAGLSKGDERSFVGSLNDVSAGRAVEARLKRAYGHDLSGVDVEVSEGVVLLSGNVPRQEDRIEAARIAWSAPDINQVGNEIMVGDKQRLVRNTKDGLLEKSVRARLKVDKYVRGRNYNVETHEGIVYLLGVARDPRELDRAARIAAMTRGTREVVSYVRVADPGVRVAEAPASGARELPDFVTRAPLPDADRADLPAPMRQAPADESVPYTAPQTVAPYALGQNAAPVDPNAPLYYIDPQTGEQIRVRTRLQTGP